MLSKARTILRNYVPAWLNVEVNRHFFQNFQEAISPQIPASFSSLHCPHWRRITQVYAVLDQHLTHTGRVATYSTLIRHVQNITGTGCSRKLIAKWKRERGLR